jgi:hypothetical protein
MRKSLHVSGSAGAFALFTMFFGSPELGVFLLALAAVSLMALVLAGVFRIFESPREMVVAEPSPTFGLPVIHAGAGGGEENKAASSSQHTRS